MSASSRGKKIERRGKERRKKKSSSFFSFFLFFYYAKKETNILSNIVLVVLGDSYIRGGEIYLTSTLYFSRDNQHIMKNSLKLSRYLPHHYQDNLYNDYPGKINQLRRIFVKIPRFSINRNEIFFDMCRLCLSNT